MINILLGMTKEERNKFVNFITPELRESIFNSIYTLTKRLKLKDVSIYDGRVSRRAEYLSKFPDGLFWDELEYQSGSKNKLYHSSKTLVSNRGDVVTLTNKKRLYITSSKDEAKKPYRGFKSDGYTLNVCRAVGSIYVIRPDHLINTPFVELEINHKDLNSGNDFHSNLEWTVPTENINHAKGLTDYTNSDKLLLEVVIDNGFRGIKFTRTKKELMQELGAGRSNINAALTGFQNGVYKGFRITHFKGEECLNKFPEEVLLLFRKDEKYFNTRNTALLCEVVKGKHTGLVFSLIGKEEVVQYLKTLRPIYDILKSPTPTCNCVFKRCSMKEAIVYHDIINESLANEIING